ncbi:MAG: DUF4139 domain-containing protein, partial [Planctomycetes bacterium]|nr:DUF4139 domain-containing protein [Planctomycetota bacterium]
DELEQDRARHDERGEYLSELIQNWCATLATVPAPGDDSPPAEWARAWQALLTRDEDYLKRRAELLDQADDLRTELNQKRHELSTGASQRTLFECFIEVQVDASSMDDVELQVTYRTPCALWRPEHLARLNRDAKQAKSGELEWTTWAVVWQRTGEDWKDVELAFSTARPAQVADAPELTDDSLSKRKKTAE